MEPVKLPNTVEEIKAMTIEEMGALVMNLRPEIIMRRGARPLTDRDKKRIVTMMLIEEKLRDALG